MEDKIYIYNYTECWGIRSKTEYKFCLDEFHHLLSLSDRYVKKAKKLLTDCYSMFFPAEHFLIVLEHVKVKFLRIKFSVEALDFIAKNRIKNLYELLTKTLNNLPCGCEVRIEIISRIYIYFELFHEYTKQYDSYMHNEYTPDFDGYLKLCIALYTESILTKTLNKNDRLKLLLTCNVVEKESLDRVWFVKNKDEFDLFTKKRIINDKNIHLLNEYCSFLVKFKILESQNVISPYLRVFYLFFYKYYKLVKTHPLIETDLDMSRIYDVLNNYCDKNYLNKQKWFFDKHYYIKKTQMVDDLLIHKRNDYGNYERDSINTELKNVYGNFEMYFPYTCNDFLDFDSYVKFIKKPTFNIEKTRDLGYFLDCNGNPQLVLVNLYHFKVKNLQDIDVFSSSNSFVNDNNKMNLIELIYTSVINNDEFTLCFVVLEIKRLFNCLAKYSVDDFVIEALLYSIGRNKANCKIYEYGNSLRIMLGISSPILFKTSISGKNYKSLCAKTLKKALELVDQDLLDRVKNRGGIEIQKCYHMFASLLGLRYKKENIQIPSPIIPKSEL